MSLEAPHLSARHADGFALQAYLLGTVDFETALALQRRFVYQVSGERSAAMLILCEHPPLITVGRSGSRAHISCGPEELRARQWEVRWVNRGGGCWLHLPGQLAIYPILALDRLDLSLEDYVQRLQQVLCSVLDEFSIKAKVGARSAGVWIGDRLIAPVGVAVRDWVSYFGAVLNISPDMEAVRRLRHGSAGVGMVTSLARERRGSLRPAHVRERLVEHFAAAFGFGRVSLFFDHPSLGRKAPSDAVPAAS